MKLSEKKIQLLPTGVLGLSLLDEAEHVCCACVDGTVQDLDMATGKRESFAGVHGSYASSCVRVAGGAVVSGGYDGALVWHDLSTRAEVRRVKAHQFWSWQTAASPDGTRIASVTGQYLAGGWKYEPAAESEPSVRVYDALSGAEVAAFSHGPPVQCAAWTPDGMHLAAANMMGEVRIWDVPAGKLAAQWTAPDFTSWGTTKSHHYCGGIFGMAFSPDGSQLAVCGMGPMGDPMAGNGRMTWQRWHWRDEPKLLDRNKDGEHGSGLMESIAWHPDGSCFAMAGRQAQGTWNAAIFSAADGKLMVSADTGMRISAARFSADGKSLFLAGGTGQPQPKLGIITPWGRVVRFNVEA